MSHLYGGNFILKTNDIHETESVIDEFDEFKATVEETGIRVSDLLWMPNSHSVFIWFDTAGRDGADSDDVLARLLLAELPEGVRSFTMTQAYTPQELRDLVSRPAGDTGDAEQKT